MLVLSRLALHCPPRATLEPSQFKLLLEDMANDLVAWPFVEIERGIAEWRRSEEAFLPTSGQLIAVIRKMRLNRGDWRKDSEAHKTLPEPERRFPKDLRPWRDILRDHGRPIPPDDSPIARGLDALQPDHNGDLAHG